MAELKTQKNDATVATFINSIDDVQKRDDSFTILELMKNVTGEEPAMWGTSIIGCGYHLLKYENGRELDWFPLGFSPRKQNFALYLLGSLDEYADLLKQLGKHKTGKGCLYINKITDINTDILKMLFEKAYSKRVLK